jgi:hypothetical protein
MNSPRSSASDDRASRFEMVLFFSFLTMPVFPLEFFFACLLFLFLGFSTGAASAFRTGSLKQSRKVS